MPKDGKVKYNLLIFQKGGIVYKSSVNVVFSKCGENNVIYLVKVIVIMKINFAFMNGNYLFSRTIWIC